MARHARAAGLVMIRSDKLAIWRKRVGRGYRFFDAAGHAIADKEVIARLRSLAVPPAYNDVRYAAEPRAHLQAVGRDAAGRLQYRYHRDWTQVRDRLKTDRLARFAGVLPRVRRRVSRDLRAAMGLREFALASVVELVALTAIRPGGEDYAKARGTRGAATLLKSNFTEKDGALELSFKAKGGRIVTYQISDARFRDAAAALRGLPGRRMFQYRNAEGVARPIRAAEVNAYLREISGGPASLKDFRTLVASARVLEDLAGREPAASDRRRNAQILAAVRMAADTLHNTPAICRKSYVLPAVVDAFEEGSLARFSRMAKRGRSPLLRAALLAALIQENG
jgi:DNA topoisomerase-1